MKLVFFVVSRIEVLLLIVFGENDVGFCCGFC